MNRSTPAKAVSDQGGGGRQEYYHDPDAPRVNSLAPTAFGVVRDETGRLLLVRRCDSGNWELPGGRIDLGESAVAAAIREVADATARRGTPRPDGVESCAAAWVEPGRLGALPIHPTMRVRIDQALAEPARAHYS